MSRSTTCVIRDEGEDEADERINQLLSTAQSFSKLVLELSTTQSFSKLVFSIVAFRKNILVTANFLVQTFTQCPNPNSLNFIFISNVNYYL